MFLGAKSNLRAFSGSAFPAEEAEMKTNGILGST